MRVDFVRATQTSITRYEEAFFCLWAEQKKTTSASLRLHSLITVSGIIFTVRPDFGLELAKDKENNKTG